MLAAREFLVLSELIRARQREDELCWARRAACAAALLMARDGDRRTALLICRRNLERFHNEELLAALVHSARMYAQVGKVDEAKLCIGRAHELFSQLSYSGKGSDVRCELAQASVWFAESNFDQAASIWQAVLASAAPALVEAEEAFLPESEESFICSLAVASVAGNLGDYVARGSRLARLEAGNNLAVCLLNNNELDRAVKVLEDLCRSEVDPSCIDGIAASNLRTLYDLARVPESLRLQLPAGTLLKLGSV